MKAFSLFAFLLSSVALAASPAQIKVETSYQVSRGRFLVHGVLTLKKDSEKKVVYQGRASIENADLSTDIRNANVDLVVKKKKDHFEGTFYFGDLYTFDFETKMAVPPSGEALHADFTYQIYDPGPPGSPIGGIWWPRAQHATELTVSY